MYMLTFRFNDKESVHSIVQTISILYSTLSPETSHATMSKKLLTFFITHKKTQDLKKSCSVWWRLVHCIVEAWSA